MYSMLPVSLCCSCRALQFILILYCLTTPVNALLLLSGGPVCRRVAASFFANSAVVVLVKQTSPALAQDPPRDGTYTQSLNDEERFLSAAYGREEYTNAIVASRDTNISPAEAYDVIRKQIPAASDSRWGNRNLRVADVGAGAGLSTTILYAEKGYHNIAAVDWSRTAWDASVDQQNSPRQSVVFYEMDDDSFFSSLPTKEMNNGGKLFDVIVYNFAINKDKAVRVARSILSVDGLLLAPCNDRKDYWYKQSYVLIDQTGTAIWTSDAYLGAWSIQFQPDVTSQDCTGIWCGNFNGFFDKQKEVFARQAESL